MEWFLRYIVRYIVNCKKGKYQKIYIVYYAPYKNVGSRMVVAREWGRGKLWSLVKEYKFPVMQVG